jgi:hypothetical protein
MVAKGREEARGEMRSIIAHIQRSQRSERGEMTM